MAFGQETYVGDFEFLSVRAPTSVLNTLVSKRDGACGSFKGGL
jgi:hypothetical protein